MKPESKLSRQQKIALLKGIQSGKITPDVLKGPQVYFFYEDDKRPGIYSGPEGKEYTEKEVEDFATRIEQQEKQSIVWREGKTYESHVIRFNCQPENEPIEDD